MGEYLTNDERLRRVGDILLKGVHLWAEDAERDAALVRESAEEPANGAIVGGEVSSPSHEIFSTVHANAVHNPSGSDDGRQRPSTGQSRASIPHESGNGVRAPDTMVDTRLRGLPATARMEDFVVQFDDVFRTIAQRRGFRTYLQGLLSRRESVKSLATLAGSKSHSGASAASMQRLQYFLCESVWDTDRLAARRLELLAAARMVPPGRAGILVIDDATSRKADSSTASITLRSLWADERAYYPLHIHPYSVAKHNSDGEADPGSYSRADIVIALVEEARAAGIASCAVMTNCSQSEWARLKKSLEMAKVPYILAIEPSGDFSAAPDVAQMLSADGRRLCSGQSEAPTEWELIVRRFGDGRDGEEEKLWVAEQQASSNERQQPERVVIVTTDPIVLPAASTRCLVTNLAQPGLLPPGETPILHAGLLEVVRLHSLYHMVKRSYRQVRRELGWDDIIVRSPRAMRRHWELTCCALLFCWQVWLAREAIGTVERALVESLEFPVSLLARYSIASAWESASDSGAPTGASARAELPGALDGIPLRGVVDHAAENGIEEGCGALVPD